MRLTLRRPYGLLVASRISAHIHQNEQKKRAINIEDCRNFQISCIICSPGSNYAASKVPNKDSKQDLFKNRISSSRQPEQGDDSLSTFMLTLCSEFVPLRNKKWLCAFKLFVHHLSLLRFLRNSKTTGSVFGLYHLPCKQRNTEILFRTYIYIYTLLFFLYIYIYKW